MSPPIQFPESPVQSFAVEVVHRLRDAGFESVWAGGCVRDALLGRSPEDFDVATSARPEEVIQLFGRKRTVPIGAAFGVVMVLGQRDDQEQVEVATYRRDGDYSDGRRPDQVTYCSAKEDALRRDFTINGMFYDPLGEELIDYVGGQEDLNTGIVRAIGNATERFDEDKLRMLRAIRFTAIFNFELEETTGHAIRNSASGLQQVSVERITQELRLMLAHPSRSAAVDLLASMTLLPVVFPDVSRDSVKTAAQILPHLTTPRFEPALAVLLHRALDQTSSQFRQRTAAIAAECRRLRLSNDEFSTITWLCDHFESSQEATKLPLHRIKPVLADSRHDLLLDMISAAAKAGVRAQSDVDFLASYLAESGPEALNPEPLLTGADLKSLGISPGPDFSRILKQIRNEQLDEVIQTRDQALTRAADLIEPK